MADTETLDRIYLELAHVCAARNFRELPMMEALLCVEAAIKSQVPSPNTTGGWLGFMDGTADPERTIAVKLCWKDVRRVLRAAEIGASKG